MTVEKIKNALQRTPREPADAALITGATGGIGEAFAAALPETTKLVLTGRDPVKLDALKSTYGDRAETLVADLTTPEGQDAVAEAAAASSCDLFINNAGVGEYGSFLDVPFEKHQATIRIDVEAALSLIHKIVPAMVDRADLLGGRAGLINVASSLAFFPVPTFATYAASKAFLLSFSESFAAEMSDQPIDILVACPGAVKTEFGARAGYSGRMPGAMSADKVASSALAALGRQSTVVIGPASAAAFTPVAMARSFFGQAFFRASQVLDKVSDRG